MPYFCNSYGAFPFQPIPLSNLSQQSIYPKCLVSPGINLLRPLFQRPKYTQNTSNTDPPGPYFYTGLLNG